MFNFKRKSYLLSHNKKINFRTYHLRRESSMKNLFSVFLILVCSGCATVDRSKYENVVFDKKADIIQVEFDRSQAAFKEGSLELCVREHIKNDAIAIGENKVKQSGVNLMFGIPMWHPDSLKYTVEASEVIVESTPNRVKALGRIPHSENTDNLAFLLTIKANETGTHYLYTDIQRMFSSQYNGLGMDAISGWIPMTSRNADRFYIVYGLMEESVNNIQRCLVRRI